jgi:hypothetical protein
MLVSIPDGNQTFSINGDRFTPGISVSNSEVGLASLSIASFFLRLVCTNGMISKTEVSASYRHVSLKIFNEFPKVLDQVSTELGKQKDQYRISTESKVDNPLMTIENFNRQFQVGEKENCYAMHHAPCAMRFSIPEQLSLRDCRRKRVIGFRRLEEWFWGW